MFQFFPQSDVDFWKFAKKSKKIKKFENLQNGYDFEPHIFELAQVLKIQ